MKFIDIRGIGLTQPLTMIICSLLILVAPIKPEAQEEPATLGAMDEQYAWVGDLGDRDALPGKPLYIEHCAGCHEAQVYKAPHTTWLELMSPQVLYRSITEGIMQAQAAHLSNEDKQHIVEYITQMRLGDPNAAPDVAWCEGSATEFSGLEESQLTGWGHDTRRFVSSDIAGFDRSQIGDLELRWSFGFPASTRARSQPTIAMGAVFVGSQDGTVSLSISKPVACAGQVLLVHATCQVRIAAQPPCSSSGPPPTALSHQPLSTPPTSSTSVDAGFLALPGASQPSRRSSSPSSSD